MHGHQNIKKEN